MALASPVRVLLCVCLCALLLTSVAEGKRKARDLTPYCGGECTSLH